MALSLGSPPPDVIRHRVFVEPGLSSEHGVSPSGKCRFVFRNHPTIWPGALTNLITGLPQEGFGHDGTSPIGNIVDTGGSVSALKGSDDVPGLRIISERNEVLPQPCCRYIPLNTLRPEPNSCSRESRPWEERAGIAFSSRCDIRMTDHIHRFEPVALNDVPAQRDEGRELNLRKGFETETFPRILNLDPD